MGDYISFCERALSEAPLWWRVVSAILAVASFAGGIAGKLPKFVSNFWAWWLLLAASLLFISIIWGAFKIHEKQQVLVESFRERSKEKCNYLIKKLAKLDGEELQSLLTPGWGGTEHHSASQVSAFQVLYWNLVADMECYNKHSPVPIEIASHWALPTSPQVVSNADLEAMLNNHKERICKI